MLSVAAVNLAAENRLTSNGALRPVTQFAITSPTAGPILKPVPEGDKLLFFFLSNLNDNGGAVWNFTGVRSFSEVAYSLERCALT